MPIARAASEPAVPGAAGEWPQPNQVASWRARGCRFTRMSLSRRDAETQRSAQRRKRHGEREPRPSFARMHKAEPYATRQDEGLDRPGGLSYSSSSGWGGSSGPGITYWSVAQLARAMMRQRSLQNGKSGSPGATVFLQIGQVIIRRLRAKC